MSILYEARLQRGFWGNITKPYLLRERFGSKFSMYSLDEVIALAEKLRIKSDLLTVYLPKQIGRVVITSVNHSDKLAVMLNCNEFPFSGDILRTDLATLLQEYEHYSNNFLESLGLQEDTSC